MRPHVATLLLCSAVACGSLDNEPLKVGVVRGQLTDATDAALVSVVGRVDLVTRPNGEGRFELTGVPLGKVELFIIINARQAQRLTVEVQPASVVELGAIEPQSSARFEVSVVPPAGQRVAGGTVGLDGTPLRSTIRGGEDEAEFTAPAGCYTLRVTVPGFSEATLEGCATAGGSFDRRVTLASPDGSPGQEGCAVSGCKGQLVCQANGACQ